MTALLTDVKKTLGLDKPESKWVVAFPDWVGLTAYQSSTGRRVYRMADRGNVRIFNDAQKAAFALPFGAAWRPASDLETIKMGEANN